MSEGTPALVAQLDLIEWLLGERARSWGPWILKGSPGESKTVSESSAQMAGLLSEFLNQSETVFISADMCTIIEAATETLPDLPLQEEQVFWPRAFLYFERPIRHSIPITPAEKTELLISTRAIYFGPGPVMDSDLANEKAKEMGLEDYLDFPQEDLLAFTRNGINHVTFIDTEEATDALNVTTDDLGTRIFPIDQSGWIYGKRWETVPEVREPTFTGFAVGAGLAQQRKLLLATFLIAQQYIAVRSSQRPTRQVRRRAERMGALPEFGEITYITLRRNSASVRERETSEGWSGYDYRFPVKGYWKHQWYPSKGEHHLIWVEPYIKGPADKPLIIKDKVYRLVR